MRFFLFFRNVLRLVYDLGVFFVCNDSISSEHSLPRCYGQHIAKLDAKTFPEQISLDFVCQNWKGNVE